MNTPFINKNNQPQTMLQNIKECQNITKISFYEDSESLSEISKDFGGIAIGHSVARVYPKTAADCKKLINFANTHNFKFVIRGRGYSQGGQSLGTRETVTLDCSQMSTIEAPNLETYTIKCQGGADWRALAFLTTPYGLIPKVMPFFPELTVGGILSIGGIGGNSHIYGCISNNVQEIEVVTGNGEIKACNSYEDPELFGSTLCGLGYCSLITSATIDLRKFKPNTKTFYLIFSDYKIWLAAQKWFVENRIDYLEAFCSPMPLGLQAAGKGWVPLTHWLYSLQVSIEYDKQEPTEAILGESNRRYLIKTGVSSTIDFLMRYGARAQNIKKSGNWKLPHPWWECILPFSTFSEIFPQLLTKVPLFFGDGLTYRIFALGDNCPPSFMKAEGLTIGLAILPSGVDPKNLSKVINSFQKLDEWLLPLGGKRCLAGWLGEISPQQWQQHYGNYYETWKINKKKHDPNNVFQSLCLKES